MSISALKRTTIFRMQGNPTSIFSTPATVGSGTRWRRGRAGPGGAPTR